MRLQYLHIFCILLALQQNLVGQMKRISRDQLNLVPTVQIGHPNDEREDYILVKPKSVVSNQREYIAIADEAQLKIKVYSKNGIFRFDFGSRGSGPSELQTITDLALAVDLQNRWIVLDRLNKKIVIYNPDGGYHASHSLPANVGTNPRRISGTPDGGYLLLAANDQEQTLFHFFDKRFVLVKSFGWLPIISDENKKFEMTFLSQVPGEITVDTAGRLYYVPDLYNGQVYIYENFELTKILSSEHEYPNPYDFEPIPASFRGGPPPKNYEYTMYGRDYRYFARQNYVPGGLNISKSGEINVLITKQTKDNYEFFLDIFQISDKGTETSFKKLSIKDVTYQEWQASAGKWYMIEQLHIPFVREYVLQSAQN